MTVTHVGVLGGGQLGRMLGLAAIPLGLSCRFVDPVDGAPASAVGPLTVAGLDDVAAIVPAIGDSDVVTYEWEGVPAATARALAEKVPVRPNADALEASQDRLTEKELFRSLGLQTAAFRAVDDRASLGDALDALGLPAILKTRRGGYDGKGQARLETAADAARAWAELGGQPLILEALVPFVRELSIVAVRGVDGAQVCWPVVENVHAEGILRMTRAPAHGWNEALQASAEACIRPVLRALDFVGVCCIELFDTGGALLANEMAPRVHNSGHWTIEGATTSQFENHLRAVAGLPLGDTRALGPTVMLNCVGEMPDRAQVLAVPGAHYHDYGKSPRPGRKLGHVTITAPDAAALDERVARVQAIAPVSRSFAT